MILSHSPCQVLSECELLAVPDCSVSRLPSPSYDHATLTAPGPGGVPTVLSCGGRLGRSCYSLAPDLASWSRHSSLPANDQAPTQLLRLAGSI